MEEQRSPRVSVILPNFNHAKYLADRIDSILNQTYGDFELIILDDASTDSSLSVLEAYKNHSKVSQVLFNQKNSGSTFIQWEKGLKIAKGEFIWIAESDDLSEPTFLEKCMEAFMLKPELGLVYSASTWIDHRDKPIHEPDHENSSADFDGNYLIKNELSVGNPIYNASSAVFKKELLNQVDFSPIKKMRYTGDWLFWTMLIKDTKVFRIGQRLNKFRRHKDNVSGEAEKEGLQFIEGYTISQYIFKNHDLGWFEKQIIKAKWAKKIALFNKSLVQNLDFKSDTRLNFYIQLFSLIS